MFDFENQAFNGPFRLRPSSLGRALKCTASVPLSNKLIALNLIPEEETGEWAAEGIAAHHVREFCLLLGYDPSDLIGTVISVRGHKVTVTDDMAEALYDGIDWIRENADTFSVEEKVSLDRWLPGHSGTVDCWFMHDGWLYLSDLKFGMRVVSSHDNAQQKAYALALWEKLGRPEIKGVLINIDQPRAFGPRERIPGEFAPTDDEDEPGAGMKFATVTIEELLEFGEVLRRTYNDISAGRVTLVPGPHCTGSFCPAREPRPGYAGCPAYNNWIMSMLLGATDGAPDTALRLPDSGDISPAHRFYIVDHRNEIKKWLESLKEASESAAMAGKPDPGSKLIMKNGGNRAYLAGAEAVMTRALGDAAWKPRELIGIPQAEKALKPRRNVEGDPDAWEELSKLIDKPPGKVALVADTHPFAKYDPKLYELEDLDDE